MIVSAPRAFRYTGRGDCGVLSRRITYGSKNPGQKIDESIVAFRVHTECRLRLSPKEKWMTCKKTENKELGAKVKKATF